MIYIDGVTEKGICAVKIILLLIIRGLTKRQSDIKNIRMNEKDENEWILPPLG